ncbi:MAG: AAA family ATPase [Polyangiaceae bacterium]|nr:AAA family ATPase [Polyangiaceae bacterium]
MKIPYGQADFARIRREGYFYADKTRFLADLESAESGYRYLVFLRPRRFGKSTLVSMMSHYYDIDGANHFDELFRGLWVHEHPTNERNKYLVLHFDFSAVETTGDIDDIRDSFVRTVRTSVEVFLDKYRRRCPKFEHLLADIGNYPDASGLMGAVLAAATMERQSLYILIDEYDHFANRLLAEGLEDVYGSIVTKTGFVRTFYATLKTGTTFGTVARLFVTGVTPLMLDDMSSGFNISTNISTVAEFNALAGFTRQDVERALDEFVAAHPSLSQHVGDRTVLFETLEAYYNGYRFSSDATDRVFNSDMVLYFLRELATKKRFPDDLLDRNVRTAYEHLQRIGALGGVAARERRELLETILHEPSIQSDIVDRFGVKSLSSPASFISLLYYMGMLTLRDVPQVGVFYDLEIPNRVIRTLQWEYLGHTLKEQENLQIDTRQIEFALGALSIRGDIAPLLHVFHEQVLQHFGIKDTQKLGEKTIKLLLMMFVSLGKVFYALSEKEFSQGYCDLFLAAAKNVPGLNYSWLLELKYVKANAKEAQINAAFADAAAQVERYSKDPTLLPLLVGDYQLKCGTLVFVGTNRILFRAWPDDVPEKRVEVVGKRMKKAAAKRKVVGAKKKASPARTRKRG